MASNGVPPSPLVGFNNNVKHRGHVFHIQTEDSGVKHPHVITHLFADGGRIVKSQRTDYTEFLEEPELAIRLRVLMREQHKAMYIALRSGELDRLLADLSLEPLPDSPPSSLLMPDLPPVSVPQPSAPPSAATSQQRKAAPKGRRPSSKPPSSKPPSSKPPSSPAPTTRGIRRPARDAVTTASNAQLPSKASSARVKSAATQATNSARKRGGDTPLIGSLSGSGRYAAARPAHIFASPSKASLFGDSSVANQSLDDVILEYLAEDTRDGTGD